MTTKDIIEKSFMIALPLGNKDSWSRRTLYLKRKNIKIYYFKEVPDGHLQKKRNYYILPKHCGIYYSLKYLEKMFPKWIKEKKIKRGNVTVDDWYGFIAELLNK